MFESLLNAFRAPDIRRRILYRPRACSSCSGCWPSVPVPGIDKEQLANFLEGNPIFGLLDLFSGGGLAAFSVVALGMNPYINASIIMQLMTGVVPSLQALSREGEFGRNKITQYTRYLTVPLAVLQAYGFLALLNSQGVLTGGFDLASFETLTQIATLTAGAIALMWIGELITERGIGNGISFIIFAGIVSRAPSAVAGVHRQPEHRDVRGLRRRRRGRGRRDHLHPGGPAPDPDPVRQPRPRPADVLRAARRSCRCASTRPASSRSSSRSASCCSRSSSASYFTTSEIKIVADIATAIVSFFNPNSIVVLDPAASS